jgi:hypothetical protein
MEPPLTMSIVEKTGRVQFAFHLHSARCHEQLGRDNFLTLTIPDSRSPPPTIIADINRYVGSKVDPGRQIDVLMWVTSDDQPLRSRQINP